MKNHQFISPFMLMIVWIVYTGCSTNKKTEFLTQSPDEDHSFEVQSYDSAIISSQQVTRLTLKSFGEEKLIKVKFPSRWELVESIEISARKSSFGILHNSIRSFFFELFRSEVYEKKNELIQYQQFYKDYQRYLSPYDAFPWKITDVQQDLAFTPLERVDVEKTFKVLLFGLAIPSPYAYSRIDMLVLNEQDSVIDGMNLYYFFEKSYQQLEKLFYIDSTNIIHTKCFLITEEYQKCTRYEKWKIKLNGHIVRYYNQDGEINTKEEKGRALNQERVGLWSEYKPNRFVQTPTKAIGIYKGGEPIGSFQFFQAPYHRDEQNNMIIDKDSKGKLLYTETYKDGKILNRTFINKPENQ